MNINYVIVCSTIYSGANWWILVQTFVSSGLVEGGDGATEFYRWKVSKLLFHILLFHRMKWWVELYFEIVYEVRREHSDISCVLTCTVKLIPRNPPPTLFYLSDDPLVLYSHHFRCWHSFDGIHHHYQLLQLY